MRERPVNGTNLNSPEAVAQSPMPVAVVGMSCRLPGAPDIEALWRLIREGREAIREVPPARWNADEFYDPDPDAPGKMVTKWGGFLDDIDLFDPFFFGVSAREADRMDPQQRLLLELAWECFEQAGCAADRFAGSRAGVYVGIAGVDYSQRLLRHKSARTMIDAYVGVGNAHSIAANRLSYLFDLRGPSLAVDTACSSALVAVHLACQAIWRGEATAALAGGINAILTPEVSLSFSHARMLSPDGRCRPFDANANGYVRAEGGGMVLLRPLSAALADGDNVLALIRGTAVNQDGRTPGITAPSAAAQRAAISEALAQAGMSPRQLGYIEAHGTGTPLGDPVEAAALAELIGSDERTAGPCYFGSVKANIGHLETASGIAGLLKAILCLHHAEIPAQINVEHVNPKLNLDAAKLALPRTLLPWLSEAGGSRVAGVNSFGFGGTNAHVVLEEAPPRAPAPGPGAFEDRAEHLLCLSAKSDAALEELTRRYVNHLTEHPTLDLADLCYTANVGRNHFFRRLAAVASSPLGLREQLQASLEGTARGVTKSARETARDDNRIVFLFSGQSAQYAGMGRALAASSPLFRAAIERCAALFEPYLERPLCEVMFDESSGALQETLYTQTSLFALQYGLVEFWRELGIKPDAVMGHSVGEFAAALAAGVFSLEDGARLLLERASAMQSLPRIGQMLAIHGNERDVTSLLQDEPTLSIAAYNGRENIVVSGERGAIERLATRCARDGLRTQTLQASHAFHSALMDPILERLRGAAQALKFAPPRIPLVSNLTGRFLQPAELQDANYWVRHLREPVRFMDGMAALASQGFDTFVELGPSPALLALGKACWVGPKATWLPSLTKTAADWETVLKSAGALYVRGSNLDWAALDRGRTRQKLSLPTYPYERRRHWADVDDAGDERSRTTYVEPLLGARIPSALPYTQYESILDLESLGFLRDHQVEGTVLFPAAAFIDVALAGAADSFGGGAHALSNVVFQQALFLTDQTSRRLQTILYPASAGESSFAIASAPITKDGAVAWTQHVTGKIVLNQAGADDRPALAPDGDALDLQLNPDDFYAMLGANGLQYGPAFRGVASVRCGSAGAAGTIEPPRAVEHELAKYALHPSLLDGCFHLLAAAAVGQHLSRDGGAFIPVAVDSVRFKQRLTGKLRTRARIAEAPDGDTESLIGFLTVSDEQDQWLGEVSALRLRRVSRGGAVRTNLVHDSFEVVWHSLEDEQPAQRSADATAGEWFVVGLGEFPDRVRDALAGAGECCRTVLPDADALAQALADAKASGAELRLVFYFDGFGHPSSDIDVRALQVAQRGLALLQVAARGVAGKRLRVFVVTRGAETLGRAAGPIALEQSVANGLVKTLAIEHPELELRAIDLDPAGDADDSLQLRDWLRAGSSEDRVAFRGEQVWVPRLTRMQPVASETQEASTEEMRSAIPPVPAYHLATSKAGSLDNLRWRPGRRLVPSGDQVEVEVCAAGLNFRDLMNAMGLYPGGPIPFGGECSGVVTAIGPEVSQFNVGDQVLGIAYQAFASHTMSTASLLARKPAWLSFEEAATIPVTFLTAHYALNHLGHMRRGDKVLIHAAAGGVGLAAVQLALHAGAEVFATTGSAEKRSFLEFIGVPHVLDSRSLSFADDVMRASGGRGVDLALNSLPGEFIPATLATLAPYGRFLEIGRTDIYLNKQLGLFPFRNNLSYHAIDLGRVCEDHPRLVQTLLDELMAMFANGKLKPLPRRVFQAEEIVASFRFMAQRRNLGKVVIAFPERREAAAQRGLALDGSYLITGGLGGLGLAMARGLIERGARNLVLWGRRPAEPSVAAMVQDLAQGGARVEVVYGDVADRNAVEQIVERLERTLPPLRGVIHAAGVLDDGLALRQTAEQVERVLAPKVRGAWNLHVATKRMNLDFFVLFSSIASVTGSPGQSNYAAANAFLDALAAQRRREQLAALSINWGPWAQVGMAARTAAARRSRTIAPFDAIPPEAGVERFFELLGRDFGQVVVAPIRVDALRELTKRPSKLLADLLGDGPAPAPKSGEDRFGRAALLALDPSTRRTHLVEYIQAQLARVLGLDKDALHPKQALNNIGMDSLMALELKEKVETSLDIAIPISAVMVDATIFDLADKVLELVGATAPAAVEAVPAAPVLALDPQAALRLLEDIDQLPLAQVDALLGIQSAESAE